MSALGTQGSNDTWKRYVETNCSFKQPINVNEISDPLDEIDEGANIEDERANRSESQVMRESTGMASMAVITIDLVLSNVAGMISGGDKEKYKLTPTEKTEYTEVWANFLRDKNIDLSPTALLLITTLCIVVPKFMEANRERKLKKQNAEYEDTIKMQEAQIKNLTKKLNNAGTGESSQV